MNAKAIAILISLSFFFAGCASQQISSQSQPLPSDTEKIGMFGPGMAGMGAAPQGTLFRPASYAPRQPTEQVSIPDGGTYRLEAKTISVDLFGKKQFLYGYNSQLPGPTLKVKQGSEIKVEFKNSLGQPTTVHWHGLRLENEFDGVPGITQDEVKPGEWFNYTLIFPDAGAYWYHPHVREEMQQERGLYGVILVEPNKSNYYGPSDAEHAIVLDDILLGQENEPIPFPGEVTNFAMMGRFGNKPLINGKESESISVKTGQNIRLYFTNTANVRPFNVSVQGAKLKMVASDGGKFEQEFLADSFTISPSERYTAEVSFSKPGTYEILSTTPFSAAKLGKIIVSGEEQPQSPAYLSLRTNSDVIDSIAPYRALLDTAPDFEYELSPEIPGATMGMELMMEHNEDGIEWEDTMFGMNMISTNESLTWRLKDLATGKSNMDASREVPVGKPFKIRLRNPKDSLHPMQHPIHLHGAQFLVVEKDGVKNSNLAWKDTVLVPVGSYVDIVSYFPNAGEWMLHCHIAEHLSSGMMTSFRAV